jgi:CheY-like chemotaxis protein
LGLAIVKGMVEAMGGAVGASPRRGGGSTFWFELPLAPSISQQEGHRVHIGADLTDGPFTLRALVVDDDPVNLLLAAMQLRQLGNEVVTVESAEDALVQLQTSEFDVALVDVQLPGMSGLELVSLARQAGAPQPLMAVMTASATAADRQAALDAGADMFVPKPASVSDVREVLRRRLERQRHTN